MKYTLIAYHYPGDKPRVDIFRGRFEDYRETAPPCLIGTLDIAIDSYKDARSYAKRVFPQCTVTNGLKP